MHAMIPAASASSLPAEVTADEVQARLEQYSRLSEGAFAANTEKAVASDTAIFAAWCQANGHHAGPPASPETVAAFVKAMAREPLPRRKDEPEGAPPRTRAPATISRYVTSIDHLHRAADLLPPGASNAVRLALKAMRREKGTRQKQAPALRWAQIRPVVEALGASPIELRDAALIAVAYDTFCRASELVALNVRDIQPEGEEGDGVAVIAKSKTDQEGQGSVRFVARDTLARVQAWVEAAHLEEGDPLFIPLSAVELKVQSERLSTRDVSRIYARRFKGVRDHKGRPIQFSAHSTRVGAASDALADGIGTGAIQQAGGWKSERMVVRYTERLAVREGAAARMARKQGRA